MNLIVEMFAVAVFVAVFMLIEGVYTLWVSMKDSGLNKFEKRLGSVVSLQPEDRSANLMKQRPFTTVKWLDDLLKRIAFLGRVDIWLRQSVPNLTVGRFLLFTVIGAVAGLILMFLFGMTGVPAVILVLAAAAIPAMLIERERTKRLLKFDEQLPEALDLITRALRAGHAFTSAIQMVATEAHDPIASEFRTTFEEINYGIPLNEAMKGLADRVPSLDLRYFIVAVIIQRETGGNLAELLGNLAMLIRERFKLIGKIRVLSAEGKMSGYVLGGLPFATAAMIYATNPGFISLLWTDPAGPRLLTGAAVLMAAGALWMRNIVRIRV